MADESVAASSAKSEANTTSLTPNGESHVPEIIKDDTSLKARLEELEGLLVKRDAAIKTMKEQAKNYIAKVDKDYKSKLEEADASIKKLQEEKLALDHRCTTLLSQQQDAVQRAAASEDALQYLKKRYDELSSSHTAAAASLQDQLNERDGSIKKLQSQIESLQAAETTMKDQINLAKKEKEAVVAEKAAVEGKLASSTKSVSQLQLQVDTLQKQLADIKKDNDSRRAEIESLKKTIAEASTKDKTSQQQLIDALAKSARVESEKTEAIAAKAKLSEEIKRLTADKEQLTLENQRLFRQLSSHQSEIRELQSSLDSAEAANAAARKALHAAEVRADDAEARAALVQTTAKHTDTSTIKLKQDLSALQKLHELTLKDLEAAQQRCSEWQRKLVSVSAENATLNDTILEKEAAVQDAASKLRVAEEESKRALDAAEKSQRKRLEAKAELVAVAASLEAEKAASMRMADTLGMKLLPKLENTVEALHNLCATLDTTYVVPDVSNGDMDGPAATHTGASSRPDDKPASSIIAQLQEALNGLLEEADAALFTATKAAAAVAQERQAAHRLPTTAGQSSDICSGVMKLIGFRPPAVEGPASTPVRARRRRNWSAHFSAPSSAKAVRKAFYAPVEEEADDSSKLLGGNSTAAGVRR